MYVQALGFEDFLYFVLHILSSRMWELGYSSITASLFLLKMSNTFLFFLFFFPLSFPNTLYIAMVSVFTEIISFRLTLKHIFLLKTDLCCLFDFSTFLGIISGTSSLAEETAELNLAVPQE